VYETLTYAYSAPLQQHREKRQGLHSLEPANQGTKKQRAHQENQVTFSKNPIYSSRPYFLGKVPPAKWFDSPFLSDSRAKAWRLGVLAP